MSRGKNRRKRTKQQEAAMNQHRPSLLPAVGDQSDDKAATKHRSASTAQNEEKPAPATEGLTFGQALMISTIPAMVALLGVWVQLGLDREKMLGAIRQAESLAAKQRAKDFRILYYEKQLNAYEEYCRVAFQIANSETSRELFSHSKEHERATADFLLYVEDGNAESFLTFNTTLNEIKNELLDNLIIGEKRIPKKQKTMLLNAAVRLYQYCRKSLQETFDLDKRAYDISPPFPGLDPEPREVGPIKIKVKQ